LQPIYNVLKGTERVKYVDFGPLMELCISMGCFQMSGLWMFHSPPIASIQAMSTLGHVYCGPSGSSMLLHSGKQRGP